MVQFSYNFKHTRMKYHAYTRKMGPRSLSRLHVWLIRGQIVTSKHLLISCHVCYSRLEFLRDVCNVTTTIIAHIIL